MWRWRKDAPRSHRRLREGKDARIRDGIAGGSSWRMTPEAKTMAWIGATGCGACHAGPCPVDQPRREGIEASQFLHPRPFDPAKPGENPAASVEPMSRESRQAERDVDNDAAGYARYCGAVSRMRPSPGIEGAGCPTPPYRLVSRQSRLNIVNPARHPSVPVLRAACRRRLSAPPFNRVNPGRVRSSTHQAGILDAPPANNHRTTRELCIASRETQGANRQIR